MANKKIKHIVAKLLGATTEETLDIYDESALHATDIVDNLTSTDATKVLSAKQGKALNDSLTNKFTNVTGFARVTVNIGTVTINNGSNTLNVTFGRTLDRIPNMLLCMMGQTNTMFIGAYGFTNNGCVIRLYNYGSTYSTTTWIIAGLVIYM